ncbi:MAG: DUF1176 domain-containing protein [Burkholderiaceae bacterium]|nr:MAG: DUF1176 domain-containing protein [Burkholderiaceae bacterium]TBR75217.1 MAG: DUF1176 domain-containing protein [Burkholderiaceae bacterium]
MRRTLATVAAAMLMLACGNACAALPAVPVYREFKDWIVGCDNQRTCVAKSAVPDESDADTLKFRRTAGAAGALTASIAADDAIDTSSFRLDGKPLAVSLHWMADADIGGYRLGGDGALALARSLAAGSMLQTSRGNSPPPVSLRGLSAALLFIDDVQGRVGNQTALLRAGSGAASAVPAAPALPVLRAAPVPPPLPNAQALAHAVRASHAALLKQHCDPDLQDFSDDSAQPLTGIDALVLLTCWGGAYQASVLVLRAPRNAPAQATLAALPPPPGAPKPDADDDPAVLTEADYSPQDATLSTSAKGRGLADCGVAAQWVFDGRGFEPSSYDYQDRCSGAPGDWLPLYRTQVEKAR